MLSFGLSYMLSALIGLAYPTYASFRAIQSVSKSDDTQWLTYWVVYSFLETSEAIFLNFFHWFPLYYELKCLFLLWLIVPQTQGAQLLFEKYIHPFLVKHASKIDPVFNSVETALSSEYANQVAKLGQKYGPEFAAQAMKMAVAQAEQLARSEQTKAA